MSPGCKNLDAERMILRLKAIRQPKCTHGFELTAHEDVQDEPPNWRYTQMIFANSIFVGLYRRCCITTRWNGPGIRRQAPAKIEFWQPRISSEGAPPGRSARSR